MRLVLTLYVVMFLALFGLLNLLKIADASQLEGSRLLQQEERLSKRSADWREVDWSAALANDCGGRAEYRLPNGSRVDILTDDVAWEVEWTEKYPEAVGQSIFYALATDREPGIWLLNKPGNDENYAECLSVVTYLRGKGVPLHFRVQPVSANGDR